MKPLLQVNICSISAWFLSSTTDLLMWNSQLPVKLDCVIIIQKGSGYILCSSVAQCENTVINAGAATGAPHHTVSDRGKVLLHNEKRQWWRCCTGKCWPEEWIKEAIKHEQAEWENVWGRGSISATSSRKICGFSETKSVFFLQHFHWENTLVIIWQCCWFVDRLGLVQEQVRFTEPQIASFNMMNATCSRGFHYENKRRSST